MDNKPVKEDSFLMKTLNSFFADKFDNLGNYIWAEVIKPAGKNMLYDAGKKALDYLIYGGSSNNPSSSSSRSESTGGSRYRQAYQQQQQANRFTCPRGSVMVDSEEQGKEILKRLSRELEKTKQPVNIPDMYDIYNDVTKKTDYVISFTDAKWGWYDLRNAEVVDTREGKMLKMPEPVYLC